MYTSKIIFILATLIAVAAGRIYNKCSLAKKLLDLDVPLEHIPKLVCVAEKRSNFDMHYHKGASYGIFGIADGHWCDDADKPTTHPCRMRCEDMTRSVGDAAACAMLIVRINNGYSAWAMGNHGAVCELINIDYLRECQSFVHMYNLLEKYC